MGLCLEGIRPIRSALVDDFRTEFLLRSFGMMISMDESVRLYLKEINKVPDLTRDEELQLVNLVLQDNDEAAGKLAEANMKGVALVALDYWGKYDQRIDLLDLILAGNTGLLQAVRSYTPSEYRFWEYAAWWVHKDIEDYIKNS